MKKPSFLNWAHSADFLGPQFCTVNKKMIIFGFGGKAEECVFWFVIPRSNIEGRKFLQNYGSRLLIGVMYKISAVR